MLKKTNMNFLRFTLISTFVSIARAIISTDDCPDHLPRDHYLRALGNSCYVFGISQERDFQAAEEECVSRQGHLVTIKDEITQIFIYNTLKHEFNYEGIVWIGLSDQMLEGRPEWVWVDGSQASYTHWAHGQLHILGGAEDCVAMDVGKEGGWYDYRCQGILFRSDQHYFVCEYPVQTPTTSTLPPQSSVSTPEVMTGTSAAATTATAAASLGRCILCGDPETQTSCTDAELQETQTSPCDTEQPYCMIDIYRESGTAPVKYYKRCADQRSCNWEWYQQYLRSDYCLHLDDNLPDILACHICCVGSGCNTGTVPPADSLWKP